MNAVSHEHLHKFVICFHEHNNKSVYQVSKSQSIRLRNDLNNFENIDVYFQCFWNLHQDKSSWNFPLPSYPEQYFLNDDEFSKQVYVLNVQIILRCFNIKQKKRVEIA